MYGPLHLRACDIYDGVLRYDLVTAGFLGLLFVKPFASSIETICQRAGAYRACSSRPLVHEGRCESTTRKGEVMVLALASFRYCSSFCWVPFQELKLRYHHGCME